MSKSGVSPILTSSLEVMQHAIEHLKMGTERDMKFAVQHADNAVELILKELARFKRIRLIDRNGHSISYYECIDRLEKKGVKMPELTDIDLLHTERNAIYHLGSQPDKEKAEWLVYDVALNFIGRVCKNELGFDITRFSDAFKLPQEVKKEIEVTRSEIVNMYFLDALNAFDSKRYEATVILTYSGIEALFREFVSREIRSHYDMLRAMREKGMISASLLNDIEALRKIRNKVVHGVSKSTGEEAKFALKVLQRVNDDFARRITKKERRAEIRKRLLPEHYESWEKMLAWVDENTSNNAKHFALEIKRSLKDVVDIPRGRNLCFYRGKPSTKTIFAAFLLTKRYLKVRIRTDPRTLRDPNRLLKEKGYRGWFFKRGQEREFKITDKEQIDYAMELIKQSYETTLTKESRASLSITDLKFIRMDSEKYIEVRCKNIGTTKLTIVEAIVSTVAGGVAYMVEDGSLNPNEHKAIRIRAGWASGYEYTIELVTASGEKFPYTGISQR